MFPQDTKVGIITFGSPARVLLKPTDDLNTVRDRIDNLPTNSPDTDLYGAILAGLKLLDTKEAAQDQRLMVMVTDGDDDRWGTTTPSADQRKKSALLASKAKSALFAKDVPNFRGVIVIKTPRRDLYNVAPDGFVLDNPDPKNVEASIQKVFQSANDAYTNEAVLTLPIPPGITGSARLTITARTAAGPVTGVLPIVLLPAASASATVQAAPVGTSSGMPKVSQPVMLAGLAAVFLAVTLLLTSATGALGGAAQDAETPVSRALSFYSVRAGRPERVTSPEKPASLSGSRVARTAINAINRLARQRKLDRALDARLEAAGLPIRTAEWSLLHIGSGIAGGVLLLIASRGMVIGAVLGLVLGLLGPWLFLVLRKTRRETKFLAQLPDTLQLLAGSLAAGYSLPQAMDAVTREARPPIRDEFNRALVETRLGMPPEDALDGIAARTASRDFSWIVMSIRIQRDVGGNLAELLSTVAETLRERERLRRQVKALSAEGRLSGIILGALPLVFALFLIFTKPEYIAPLFNTPLGLLMLGVGAVLLVIGGIWMAKVVTVEV